MAYSPKLPDILPPNESRCSKCRFIKCETNFGKFKNGRLHKMCIDCLEYQTFYSHRYYHSNKDEICVKRKLQRCEETRNRETKYYYEEPNHIYRKKKHSDYYQKNREIILLKKKELRDYKVEVQALMNIYID